MVNLCLYFILAFIRHQSTISNPNMKPPRKKRLRGVKKYAELLVGLYSNRFSTIFFAIKCILLV